MVNRKERINFNMIGGYIDGFVSGQVSLHSKLNGKHRLDMKLYEWIDLWVSRQVDD